MPSMRRYNGINTPFTRYNWLSNRLNNRLDVGLHESNRLNSYNQLNTRLNVCIHDTAGISERGPTPAPYKIKNNVVFQSHLFAGRDFWVINLSIFQLIFFTTFQSGRVQVQGLPKYAKWVLTIIAIETVVQRSLTGFADPLQVRLGLPVDDLLFAEFEK